MKPYASYKASGVDWLGVVPSHWAIKKIKFVANLRSHKTDDPPLGTRYVGLEHIESQMGRFVANTDAMQTESESTVTVFQTHDVLFGKLRPYLAKAAVADTNGVCSSEILVLEPLCVAASYLKLFLLLDGFIKTVDGSTFGSKMPRADWGFIGQQRLPVPTLAEQHAIAAYLDHETARVDALLQGKQALIALLREYRQSTISSAVTQGLNPAAPRKPSGIAWLGDVPKHWVVSRLRFAVQFNPRPRDNLRPEQNVSFLPMEAISETGALDLELVKAVEDVSTGYTYFEDGDLTIAKITPCYENGKGAVMSGLLGGIGFGTTELIVMRPGPHIFVHWLYFLTFSESFRAMGESSMYGAGGQKRVSEGFFKDCFVGIPPLAEQHAIAAHLDRETARIDALIAHAQAEISLLKELRAATIGDAVLGRVDVRTV